MSERDYGRSRAILIGNGTYQDPDLPDVPASASLQAMVDLFHSELCGWPLDRVTVLSDIQSAGSFGIEVSRAVKGVEDLLVVYYVGHGLRTRTGELALAVGETYIERELRDLTSLPYSSLARIIGGCSATTKVIILDCCQAELSHKSAHLSLAVDVEIEPTDGFYVICASRKGEAAKAPIDGSGPTYFTSNLVSTIREGIANQMPWLQIRDIFVRLRDRLINLGLPEPVDYGHSAAWRFGFSRNPRYIELSPSELAGWSEGEPSDSQRLIRELVEALARKDQELRVAKTRGSRVVHAVPGGGPQISRAGSFSCVELNAGLGGQALGVERAGFVHAAVVERDGNAVDSLKANTQWPIIAADLREVSLRDLVQERPIALISASLQWSTYSTVGQHPSELLRLVREARPNAIMVSSSLAIASSKFDNHRDELTLRLRELGYMVHWNVLDAVDFGVPQLRRTLFTVALMSDSDGFAWPSPPDMPTRGVGEILEESMASNGWKGAHLWAFRNYGRPAPTLIGGSAQRGGGDLGPSRARAIWQQDLHIDGRSIGACPPDKSFPLEGMPRLTVPQVALLQDLPMHWRMSGGKTSAYRQAASAVPPALAEVVAARIRYALMGSMPRGSTSVG